MSEGTQISWTDATWADDRGRSRTYIRVNSTRPGQQLRRQMAMHGLSYCRGCQDWLPAADVRQGACKPHIAQEYRARYASDPTAIRQRVHARKRGISPMPVVGIAYLIEQFSGHCAYCPAMAETWDHILAVSRGGRTEPGNIVPACTSCNSSKKANEVIEWLLVTDRTPNPAFYDVAALEVA